MTSCPNCYRRCVALVVFASPRGEYALCSACIGGDLEKRKAPSR